MDVGVFFFLFIYIKLFENKNLYPGTILGEVSVVPTLCYIFFTADTDVTFFEEIMKLIQKSLFYSLFTIPLILIMSRGFPF